MCGLQASVAEIIDTYLKYALMTTTHTLIKYYVNLWLSATYRAEKMHHVSESRVNCLREGLAGETVPGLLNYDLILR